MPAVACPASLDIPALARRQAALLIAQAGAQGDPWKIVGFGVYGFSLVLLFVALVAAGFELVEKQLHRSMIEAGACERSASGTSSSSSANPASTPV